MITTVTVLSYEAMRERARDHGVPANAVVVSIIDPEEEPIFEYDTDRIITLRFHDLDPAWPVDPERDPRPSYVFMSAEQARQIVGEASGGDFRIVNRVLLLHISSAAAVLERRDGPSLSSNSTPRELIPLVAQSQGPKLTR